MHHSQILCNQVASPSGIVGYYYFKKQQNAAHSFPTVECFMLQVLINKVILDVLSMQQSFIA
jgi:hypothetical protein